MARLVVLVAFLVQAALINASDDEAAVELPIVDEPVNKHQTTDFDWKDLFSLPRDAANKITKKPTEEELEDMKEMAKIISLAIHNEMAHLLSYAFRDSDEVIEKELRSKRSTDDAVDPSVIISLLKHIKANNEFQNIAIEKIMAAKQLAEESGLDFTPDSEIFTELAIASSKQIEELSAILNNSYHSNNIATEIEFVPVNNEPIENSKNSTYYNYDVDTSEHDDDIAELLTTPPPFELEPEILQSEENPSENFIHIKPHKFRCHYHWPIDSQIPPPPHNTPEPPTPAPPIHAPPTPIDDHISFSYLPDFFEELLFSPSEYSHHIPIEPVTSGPAFDHFDDMLLFEEEAEPELVGEELEETVSSKVLVNRGKEAGTATVNHVMTYTVSEKSHFKKPELELPKQVQYYFMMI